MADIQTDDIVYIVGGREAEDFADYEDGGLRNLLKEFAADSRNKVRFFAEYVDQERGKVHIQAMTRPESAKQRGIPGYYTDVPLRFVSNRQPVLESAGDMEALYVC